MKPKIYALLMLLLMLTLLVLSIVLLYGFFSASVATVILVAQILHTTASCIFDILYGSGRIRFYANIDCCEIHERIFPIIAAKLDRRMNRLFAEANGSNTDDWGLATDNLGQAFVQAYSEIISLSI